MKKNILIVVFVSLLLVSFTSPLFSNETVRTEIKQWLQLGPAAIPKAETELFKTGKAKLDAGYIQINQLQPIAKQPITWSNLQTLTWKINNSLDFNTGEQKILYLATYLEPTRWLKIHLIIDNPELELSAFLDGKKINSSKEKEQIITPLIMTNEKHLLVLKILLPKGKQTHFKTYLENETPFTKEIITHSLIPRHNLKLENILNMISINAIHVSPNGRLVAVSLGQRGMEAGKTERWMEILDTSSGNCIFSSRGIGTLNGMQWLQSSTAFTYTKNEDKKTSILLYDLNTHQRRTLKKGIENFSSYEWAPNNSFILYSTFNDPEKSKGYKRIKEIPHRAATPEMRYSLYLFFPPMGASFNGGVTHQIGNDEQDFSFTAISPDSKKILLGKVVDDYKMRPYLKYELYLLNLSGYSRKKLFESHHISSMDWAPDSRRILLRGGPSAFDGAGLSPKLGKDVIPNDYDNQAYIYDCNTNKVDAISINFNPSINGASWSASLNNIYFTAEDKTYVRLYKYSVSKKLYKQLNTGIDVISRSGFARNKKLMVFRGSGAVDPQKLYKMNLGSNRAVLLKDYNREAFSNVTLGKCVDADMNIGNGKKIKGRLHYPANFNPNKKYPCIVYYYGGTSPVDRRFGGRYPMNWYAAHGYVVYVLQPTGATGFGQKSSAVHVNDWGEVTSEEIIASVKELIRTHTYIDPSRIGAMGASYGGFLTQYLATQTDIFAAFISHAGISSIASYWGVGDWGYTYSGVATANSFPWNRKDIYVGHSPLFMADRIKDPLLLLHGSIDNNVPPGESYQMYAALKLLGKEVELITYDGQQHFIIEYNKRVHWMRTIMAWWDKHLKDQPQHWDHLFKLNQSNKTVD